MVKCVAGSVALSSKWDLWNLLQMGPTHFLGVLGQVS